MLSHLGMSKALFPRKNTLKLPSLHSTSKRWKQIYQVEYEMEIPREGKWRPTSVTFLIPLLKQRETVTKDTELISGI